jgi:hypothetical protein
VVPDREGAQPQYLRDRSDGALKRPEVNYLVCFRGGLCCGPRACPGGWLLRLVEHAHVSGIQAVFDVYDYLDERRHALEAWASFLEELVNPRADGKVVPLRAVGE